MTNRSTIKLPHDIRLDKELYVDNFTYDSLSSQRFASYAIECKLVHVKNKLMKYL